MAIDFGPERWATVKETYGKFWAGTLGRPVIPIELAPEEDGGGDDIPLLAMDNVHRLDIPAEAVVERWDKYLSGKVYLGDAFPRFTMVEYGPGLMAAFMGGRLDNSTGLVWFHPAKEQEIEDIHFEYDPENVWFNRIKDLCRAAVERWDGQVQVSMPDLGGNLDVLSTFRPSEKLLMDLIDKPEEVKRLVWEAHELWHRYYAEINEILQPVNPGYSAWANLLSDEPYYMLQCDFAYMIGPGMFDEFSLPELKATCKKLGNPFFHLDGPGMIGHLDSLLGIPDLKGVQWVPGSGQKTAGHWPEIFQKIYQAGRLMQVTCATFEDLDAILQVVPEPGRIAYKGNEVEGVSLGRRDEVVKALKHFGLEC